MPGTGMQNEAVMNPKIHDAFIRILKDELIPSMGCTEPVSLALAAARARDVLGMPPERAVVKASGSIIKNARSVSVPHTGGLHGIPAAVAAGIAGICPHHRPPHAFCLYRKRRKGGDFTARTGT